jgi:MFS family permease
MGVGVAGAGAVIGLLVSGVLLEMSGWKSVFALNAALAGLEAPAALRLVPNSCDAHRPKVDHLGGRRADSVGIRHRHRRARVVGRLGVRRGDAAARPENVREPGILDGGLSRQVPRLAERVSRRPWAVAGLLLMALGGGVLSQVGSPSSYWVVLAGILPIGAGMALATSPATTEIVKALPEHKQGVASAVNDAARDVGGTLGIAGTRRGAQRAVPVRCR